MTSSILVTLHNKEGAFLRSIGVAERRGFKVTEAHLQPETDNRLRLELRLEARGGTLAVLARQLERLHDVIGVSCEGASWASPKVAEAV